MSSDFNLKRDWKYIKWLPTIQYFSLRAVASGIVWFIIVGFTQDLWIWWFPLITPLIIIAFILPLVLFTTWLSRLGVPYVGLLSIMFLPVIIFGDPLIWVLATMRPDLVPVEKPPFMRFNPIIFVTEDPDDEVIEPCPVAGRILSDDNIEFMGHVYPLRKTLFIIGEDWSVATLYDENFGFIDMEGSIKKGQLQQGIDPREITIGEMVAYIVSDKTCYDLNRQRIGAHESVPYIEPVETARTDLEELSYKLGEIEAVRKLKRSDFPPEQNLSDYAGQVLALKNLSFLDSEWDEQEMLFEINLLGQVRTPYDKDFGCVEGTGEIIKESTNGADTGTKVATIMGKYCYSDNEKIGQFIPQQE